MKVESRKSAESGAGRLPHATSMWHTQTHTHIPNKLAFTQCQTLSNKCTKLGRGLSHKDRGRTGKVTAKHTHCVCVCVCGTGVCVAKMQQLLPLAAVGRKKAQKALHVAHSQQQQQLV